MSVDLLLQDKTTNKNPAPYSLSPTPFHSIGTRNESSLHKTLKYRYTGSNGRTEVDTGEFVADGVREDGEYIEVQTGSFAPLKKKIKALSDKGCKVRIIHPIAVNKYIEVYEEKKTKPRSKRSFTEGNKKNINKTPCSSVSSAVKNFSLSYRRKSPKKGTLWSLFDALVHAPDLATLPGVTIEAVLADITEIRIKDGKGSWRRKGVSISDRGLAAFHESVIFTKKADYARRFIPFKKNEEFTSALLASRAGIDTGTARQALYVLEKIGVVMRTGKKGKAWVYTVVSC